MRPCALFKVAGPSSPITAVTDVACVDKVYTSGEWRMPALPEGWPTLYYEQYQDWEAILPKFQGTI